MEKSWRAWGVRGLFYGFVICCGGAGMVWLKTNFDRYAAPADPADVAFMAGTPYDGLALLLILTGIAIVLIGCLALLASMLERFARERR